MQSRNSRDLFPPATHWDRPPHNRWSFQHIREILPTVEVWRGDGPASALASAPQDITSLRFAENGHTRTIGQWLDESFTDGFLVLHKGRIIAEHYLNGMNARTLHLSQSMAKSVTATAFGVLQDRGLLDPQAPVTHYLPELAATAWKGATLQHCLDMTSGVAYNEEYTIPDADMAKTDVASGWKPMPQGIDWPTHIWAQILTLKATTRPHGERFEYRSIETDILAFAMQAVTGKPLAEIISQEIWQPIGAQESACFTVDAAGYALADGGLNACLRDYARFAKLWVHDGQFNGKRILSQSWVDATHKGDASKYGHSDISPLGAYKNQFWLRDVSRRILMARGVFGQLIYIDPEHDFAAVKLSSWPEFTSTPRSLTALKAVEAIVAALT